MSCEHGYKDRKRCPECKAPPNAKATSPAAGPASFAGSPSGEGGTGQGLATGGARMYELGSCKAAVHMQAGLHSQKAACENWLPDPVYGSPSGEGGTGQVLATGRCKIHNTPECDQGLHCRQDDCKDWQSWPLVPGMRTAIHTETANSKQVGGEHYKKSKIEPWDFIIANDIPFLEGCVIKHVARHRDKGGRQDLEKAIHYLQKALEVYYPKDPT